MRESSTRLPERLSEVHHTLQDVMEAQATAVQRRRQQSGVRQHERQEVGRCSEVKEEPAKRPPAARRGEGYAREVDDAPARKGNGLGGLRDQSPDPRVIFGVQRGRILQRTLSPEKEGSGSRTVRESPLVACAQRGAKLQCFSCGRPLMGMALVVRGRVSGRAGVRCASRLALVEDTSSSSLSCRRSDVLGDSRFGSPQCFSFHGPMHTSGLVGCKFYFAPLARHQQPSLRYAGQTLQTIMRTLQGGPRWSALFIRPLDNVRPLRALPELFTSGVRRAVRVIYFLLRIHPSGHQ